MTIESAQPERPAGGSEIQAEQAPESALAIEDPSTGNEPQAPNTAGGLPWYVANKFGWRNNKTGPGRHLAPHESYVQDVLTYGLQYGEAFTPDKESDEFEMALSELEMVRGIIEIRNQFDVDDDEAAPVKMEAKCILRDLRTRYLLALKITGSCQTDRVYAIENAQLNDWDVNNTTNSDRFIQSGNTRDKWARKAGYYGFIISQLAIVFNDANIDLNLEGGIRQSLYSDARDAKQRLDAPPQLPRSEVPTEQKKLAETLAA